MKSRLPNTSGSRLRGISLFFLSFTLLAASAQKVSVEVVQISENRSSSRLVEDPASFMDITIEVSGLQLDHHHYLKPARLSRAADNLGNSLLRQDELYEQYDYSNTPMLFQFRLLSSERKATEISVLEGTLKYFTPTVANKGLVNVDKPVDKLGTNILKGKYADGALVLLDRKKLQGLKSINEKAYQQQIDKLKKEYGHGAESMQDLEELLDDSDFGDDNELFFFIHNPKGQIIGVNLRSADGTDLTYSGN